MGSGSALVRSLPRASPCSDSRGTARRAAATSRSSSSWTGTSTVPCVEGLAFHAWQRPVPDSFAVQTLNPDVFVVMADLLLRETRAGRSDASPAAASLARVVLAWSRRRPLPPRVAVDVLRAASEHSRGALHPEAAGAESTSSVGASASGVASAPGAVASALLRAAAAALSAAGPLSLPLARTCTAHTVEYALLLADPGSLSRVRVRRASPPSPPPPRCLGPVSPSASAGLHSPPTAPVRHRLCGAGRSSR